MRSRGEDPAVVWNLDKGRRQLRLRSHLLTDLRWRGAGSRVPRLRCHLLTDLRWRGAGSRVPRLRCHLLTDLRWRGAGSRVPRLRRRATRRNQWRRRDENGDDPGCPPRRDLPCNRVGQHIGPQAYQLNCDSPTEVAEIS